MPTVLGYDQHQFIGGTTLKNNKTTQRLLDATREIWEGYLKHPFVRGIADGSLEIQKFRFYLLQDYVYLFDYAKVFAQGVVKSRDPEVMRMFAVFQGDEASRNHGGGRRARQAVAPEQLIYCLHARCRGGGRPGGDHGSGAFLRAQL